MLPLFIYTSKDIFLQTLHPLSLLFYLLVLAGGALLLSHPLSLAGLMLVVLGALILAEGYHNWLKSLKPFMMIGLLLLIINSLANNLGNTVLWSFSAPAGLGPVNITLENLIFSLVMFLRLVVIFSVFTVYNLVVNPDQALSLFARAFPRSALLVALAAKTIPSLALRLKRAAEIQQCRGVNLSTGNLIARIKNRLPLIKVLLLSSLEESFNLAESIQGRAYGSGPRSSYFPVPFKLRDYLTLASTLGALTCMAYIFAAGLAQFQFYPGLGRLLISKRQLALLLLPSLLLLVPLFLAWGWKKWACLK